MVVLPPRFQVVRLGSVASTNIEADRLAAAGAADGTFVVASEQTAGRGRAGRIWQSPPGNLYCSLVLRPDCPPAAATNLSFIAALALADALDHLIGGGDRPAVPVITCKWPNDVLVDGGKIAGILLDSALAAGSRIDRVIIGTGVNVAWAPADAHGPCRPVAVSAWDATIAPDAVLAAYAVALDGWLEVWTGQGFGPIRAAWLGRAHGRGRRVLARVGTEAIEGVFLDLDPTGALLLGLDGGGERRIAAGDVFPVAGCAEG